MRKRLIIAGLIAAAICVMPNQVRAADGETKIHFISLSSTTDAILLESNGHFGMVDSGEDWEYPDGSDERYPFRNGITTGIGFEQQVIHYLKSQGVEKLDFYIATHSHSDHIGSGDEILDAIPTDKLYINRYDDANMIVENDAQLWDNQYVYDDIIEAANRNGVQIITDLDLEENSQYCQFTLGDMSIELMNVDRRRDENGQIIPVNGENENCIVTKVTAFGRTALLTADIGPGEGDTAKIAEQLIEELGDSDANQLERRIAVRIKEKYPEIDYESMSDVDLELLDNDSVKKSKGVETIDESKKNTGKTISIDLMKMNHHSMDYNNTTYFLTSLNPKNVVITGYQSWFNARERDCLPNTKVYATVTDSAAVIAEFQESGIQVSYAKMNPGWLELNGEWYYFDENGRTYTDQGVHELDGKVYCFNQKGALEAQNRWVLVNGRWKYWLTSNEYYKNGWLELNGEKYYLDENGNAVTGWKKSDGNWYYFAENAAMVRDTWIGDYYLDENGIWDQSAVKNQWISSGNRWWYRHGDGSYTKSDWEVIGGKRYYFDASGWMVTGWQLIEKEWYYFYDNGAMASDVWIGTYYVDESGVWIPTAMKNQWISSGNRWWYRHGDGSYTKSDWEVIGGKRYYFDASGWMVTGWRLIEKEWYYFYDNGVMASDVWIGNYYLKGNGKMAVSEWVQDGSYYVDEKGLWVPK